jgi:hypothetical protein
MRRPREDDGEEPAQPGFTSTPPQGATQTAAPAAPPAAPDASGPVPTLFVSGPTIKNIFDVFDFFKFHNVNGSANECVFVTASKKPYALLDWERQATYDASLGLNGQAFKEQPVAVRSSTQSAAQYLVKKPDAQSLTARRHKRQEKQAAEEQAQAAAPPHVEEAPAAKEAVAVPLAVLMMRQRQQQLKQQHLPPPA